jgi:hypothetical protein
VLLWSTGSGIIIGLIFDALLVGGWMVTASFLPALAPRSLPRWAMLLTLAALAAIPLAAGLLGYLEGRLKLT